MKLKTPVSLASSWNARSPSAHAEFMEGAEEYHPPLNKGAQAV